MTKSFSSPTTVDKEPKKGQTKSDHKYYTPPVGLEPTTS